MVFGSGNLSDKDVDHRLDSFSQCNTTMWKRHSGILVDWIAVSTRLWSKVLSTQSMDKTMYKTALRRFISPAYSLKQKTFFLRPTGAQELFFKSLKRGVNKEYYAIEINAKRFRLLHAIKRVQSRSLNLIHADSNNDLQWHSPSFSKNNRKSQIRNSSFCSAHIASKGDDLLIPIPWLVR